MDVNLLFVNVLISFCSKLVFCYCSSGASKPVGIAEDVRWAAESEQIVPAAGH
jgi:hypothetical protein